MKNEINVSEYIIIGFTTTSTLIILILLIFNIQVNDLINLIKNASNAEIILFSLTTYVIGLITHRIISTINYKFFKIIVDWRITRLIFSKRDIRLIKEFNRDKWAEKYMIVLQYGSQELINKINNGDSFIRIFKSLAIILPVTTIVGTIWIIKNNWISASIFYALTLIILSFLSFKSHRISIHYKISQVEFGIKILNNIENNNNKAQQWV